MAALHHRGIRAARLIPGATDGEVFRIFVERVLLPELKRGDTVVWDNLSAHKTHKVARFLQDHPHVKFHFTPTYSSWLNQVEIWFSRIDRDVIARGVFTSVRDLKSVMFHLH